MKLWLFGGGWWAVIIRAETAEKACEIFDLWSKKRLGDKPIELAVGGDPGVVLNAGDYCP